MLNKRTLKKRNKEEKERILLDINRLGVVAGCRKHGISRPTYYDWLEKYNQGGIQALEDRLPKQSSDAEVALLKKELNALKELLVEKELIIHFKDQLLKKKNAQSLKSEP